jgi:hypothetical protein
MKDLIYGILALAFIIAVPASWITHVIVCIDTERWGFLVAGSLMFPVAMIHGVMIWLGLA